MPCQENVERGLVLPCLSVLTPIFFHFYAVLPTKEGHISGPRKLISFFGEKKFSFSIRFLSPNNLF